MEPAPAPPTDPPPTPPLYWLFVLCALLTVGVWLQVVYDFFRQNASNLYGGFPAEVYLLMLGAYGGTKAVKRAAGDVPPDAADQRLIKGEYFIILWAVTGFVLGEIHSHHLFGIIDASHDLRTVLWGVGTIFFGTSSAKFLHDRLAKGAPAPIPAPRAPAPGGSSQPPSDPWANNFPDEPDNGTQAPQDEDLRKRVLELLHTDTKGFTRTQIEKTLSVKRKLLQPVLHELVDSGRAFRVGNGPTDPNTRYVLAEYHKINEALK